MLYEIEDESGVITAVHVKPLPHRRPERVLPLNQGHTAPSFQLKPAPVFGTRPSPIGFKRNPN
ncbi:hypothetical protein [Siphonobacter sp. BAB-5385]|uniref:hypothetical protein n=1 Tax=Siphonobacter sp. BAB-5385 TaxID=1864822 RepID=UPI0020CB80E1|nr:hypothetical protein [Siphonobacter sp. BAB-5385]